MQIKENTNPENVIAAVALLKPIAPGITPRDLTDAIKGYEPPKPAAQMPEPRITIQEAAALLRVSVPSVRRYIADGKIKASRVNRFYRIDPADIRAMLNCTANA